MKNFTFGLMATMLLLGSARAQTNNPYNQQGIDFLSASKVLYKEYQEGKLSAVNQETIDYYFKTLLPNYTGVNLADFNLIVGGLKNTNNAAIIKNSGYSDEAKAFLQKSLESYSITKLVDAVQSSKIDVKEKEDILIVLAINYNLIKPYFDQQPTGTTKGSFDLDEYASIPIMTPNARGINSFVWGGLGYIFGSALCVPCGAVGAIIGVVTGGWMDEKGIRPVISTGTSSGSGSGSWTPQP